ncbi:ABC transporter substrate binding protein [Catenovulum adriaticum]|uniref:EAL domain-containing protein n=1 Tax=Catenovulum adriaticum TaxID=2984846 RepID=A0ABY7AMC3_9ALTE|nr:ABC transporter substrate binding protein [Catenovulum sp. TS8]WAJ69610.1 EAL domain-containing protein [Catenovulum sp. TS8]
MFRPLLVSALCLLIINKVLAKQPLHILTVHSYHQSYLWTQEQDQEFRAELIQKLPEYDISFSVEYLNAKHIPVNAQLINRFYAYANEKYLQFPPDLIYVTDDPAAQILLNQPAKFIKQTPIVFSGVNNMNLLKQAIHQNVTGVFQNEDLNTNIKFIKKLLPKTEQLLFLGDTSTTDEAIAQQLTVQDVDGTSSIKVIHIKASHYSDLLKQIKKYPNSPIVSGSLGAILNQQNKIMSTNELLDNLSQLNRPVFKNSRVREGVLGGFQPTTPYGQLAADLAVKIIQGQSIESTSPIISPPTEFILHWDKIQDLGLTPNQALLNDVKIINQPSNFFTRYKTTIFWLSIILCAIAILTILSAVWIIKQRNKLIEEQQRDALTECPNRLKLINQLKLSPDQILLLIDINDFSVLNNFYGNQIGDKLLQEFTRVARNHLIRGMDLYRTSGDIFAILLPSHFTNKQTITFTENLIFQLENYTFISGDLNISINVVAGISSSGSSQRINQATTALNNAKQERKSWSVYQPNLLLQEKQTHNAVWSRKLKSALFAGRITAYFQPIVNVQTGHICSYEALVRLIDKDGSVVSPFHFLEIAKKNRQYPLITKIMLDKSIQLIKQKRVNVSINLTLADIYHQETVNYLLKQLSKDNVGQYITFEVTENEGIENHEQINEFTQKIKSLGCRLSIDDFGTGYANFSHLIDLNADHLKIDGSIIKRLLTDAKTELVVATIIGYAKRMEIKTVAEFVDSDALLNKTKAMGFDYAQGYYLGKPDAQIIDSGLIYLEQLNQSNL